MRKNTIIFIILITVLISCKSQKEEPNFGKIALKESRVPVRAGNPDKISFWNKYSKRFIYAPAFDFEAITNAEKYRYEIVSLKDSSTYHFESDVPYAPLSPVWEDVPVSLFNIQVIGLSNQGDSLGLAGNGQFYRASPFDPPSDGTYHKPVMPYDSSAMIALDSLLNKDYVNYWLIHKSPDPNYKLYRYPAKIMGALISGAATYAKLITDADEENRAKKLAMLVANYLLDISEERGSPLEYFPPTYYGYNEILKNSSFMQRSHTMMTYAVNAGRAYLDLYDLTDKEKYFFVAKRIARTYVERQRDDGTWYLFVNNKTGKPLAENLTIPLSIINYFVCLQNNYHMKGLKEPIQKALDWVMENPVKTFNWQGQFEDVGPRPSYKNQSREQACMLAIYLFKKRKKMNLAKTLVRFAEDQFVIWEKPMDIDVRSSPAYHSENWITPSVHEQYRYWMPVTRSAGIMINTYWYAYKATHKKIYLAKAKSIANSLTLAQNIYDGNYPTYFTKSKYPSMSVWINNIVWPAKTMLRFGNNLKKLR